MNLKLSKAETKLLKCIKESRYEPVIDLYESLNSQFCARKADSVKASLVSIALIAVERYQDARALLEKYIKYLNKDCVALSNLSFTQMFDSESYESAIKYACQALSINSTYKPAIINLANLYLLTRRTDEALNILSPIASTAPDDHEVSFLLGKIYRYQGNSELAEKYLYIAYSKHRNIEEYILELVLLYRQESRDNDAFSLINQTSISDPTLLLEKATLLLEYGKTNEAITTLELLLATNKAVEAFRYLALIHATDAKSLRQQIIEYKTTNGLRPIDLIQLDYALGHTLIRNQVDSAFEFFTNANSQWVQHVEVISPNDVFVDDIKAASSFEPSFSQDISVSSMAGFILGMPRCGSTLLENLIIANFPGVQTVGESQFLRKSCDSNSKNIDEIVSAYYSKAESYFSKKLEIKPPFFVDKNLFNVALLNPVFNYFPSHKAVFLYRNPYDHILAIYSTYFADNLTWSLSFESIIEMYHQYLLQISYLPASNILPIKYESMVSDPISTLDQISKWFQLDNIRRHSFIDHHKSNQTIKTASLISAREPVKKDSYKKWAKYHTALENYEGQITSLNNDLLSLMCR